MMKNLITILLLLAINVSIGFSQNEDLWKSYSAQEGAFKENESHTIIYSLSMLKTEYNTSSEMRFKIIFKTQYDTLHKKESEKFKWIVNPMPEGANFNSKEKEFIWKPKVEQIGEYEITFYVKHEDLIDSIKAKFTVVEEWNSSWTPGVSFTLYQPTNKEKYGNLMGPSVEYLLFSWIHRNENRGPSHGRVYLKLDLLSSDLDTVSESFLYSVGVDLSLERNARRNWLIPYYGLEMGGFYHDYTKNVFYLAPVAGIWIYSSQNIFVTADLKYQFPTESFEDLKGFKANIGFNFSLW
jgi:hypothetical protein